MADKHDIVAADTYLSVAPLLNGRRIPGSTVDLSLLASLEYSTYRIYIGGVLALYKHDFVGRGRYHGHLCDQLLGGYRAETRIEVVQQRSVDFRHAGKFISRSKRIEEFSQINTVRLSARRGRRLIARVGGRLRADAWRHRHSRGRGRRRRCRGRSRRRRRSRGRGRRRGGGRAGRRGRGISRRHVADRLTCILAFVLLIAAGSQRHEHYKRQRQRGDSQVRFHYVFSLLFYYALPRLAGNRDTVLY